MVSHICDLSIWKAEVGGSESQASLGYRVRPCLKKGQEQNQSWSSCLAHEGLDSIRSVRNKKPHLSLPTAVGLALQGSLILTDCPSSPLQVGLSGPEHKWQVQ